MPLFLVTLAMDEGLSQDSYRVIEAGSDVEIAQHMLTYPQRWRLFLESTVPVDRTHNPNFDSLWEILQEQPLSPEKLLRLIRQTHADRHYGCQLRIYPVSILSLVELPDEKADDPESS